MLAIRNDFKVLDGKIFELKMEFDPSKDYGKKYEHWVKLGKELKKVLIEADIWEDEGIKELNVMAAAWHKATKDFIMEYLQEHWSI